MEKQSCGILIQGLNLSVASQARSCKTDDEAQSTRADLSERHDQDHLSSPNPASLTAIQSPAEICELRLVCMSKTDMLKSTRSLCC
jgi:hypothetical protein